LTKSFDANYSDNPFHFFSSSHYNALIILVILYLFLFLYRNKIKNNLALDNKLRITIASLLILQEIAFNLWRYFNGIWSVANSLPLHLCGISIILSAIMLLNNKYLLFEINYFWGLGGAIQALFTPDIGMYGFPHFRFFQFFVSHGLIVLAVLYMIFIMGYRPKHKSVWKIILITNIYMIFIAGFNMLSGGNYLFICHKPVNGSIIDFMGPWPWYILTLELVGIISFYLYYSPVGISNMVSKYKIKNKNSGEIKISNG